MAFGDRVKETTTSTGTGNITLAGAVTGFQTFSAEFQTGDRFDYVIDDGAGSWEMGVGYLSASTTLVRDVVWSSSNAGSAVNFAAGTKTVFVTASGRSLQEEGIEYMGGPLSMP